MNDPLLHGLAAQLLEHKIEEDFWKKKRIESEEVIAAQIPGPEKGQKTVTLEDGTKITVERGLTYKADLDAISELLTGSECPPPIKAKTAYELDIAGYEWYRDNMPDSFDRIVQHVTVTPRKVSVSVKAAKENT